VGIEGTYLSIIKGIYDKPTANIILDSEKLKAFPTTILQIGKEEVKWSLYADDMILYIEKSKDSNYNSWDVQWLRLCASTAGSAGSVAGWGTTCPMGQPNFF